jgi:hypothetical protein
MLRETSVTYSDSRKYLTPCNPVLLEKLVVAHLAVLKTFRAFYGA